MRRTIFIWDIHGCFDEFVALLDKINYIPSKDKLYLTWDLINKWPKSFEVINFLVKNPQIKSVIWNNEIILLKLVKNNWLKKYFHSHPRTKYLSSQHLEYIQYLPLYIETKEWILLHGWLFPWKKIKEHTADEITTIRTVDWKNWYEFYTWEKVIIYWHYAKDWLRIRKKTKWLDSWCVYWKRLTAYIFETWEIIQQSAFRQYVKIT